MEPFIFSTRLTLTALALLAALTLATPVHLHAHVGEMFGFGARMSGLAGATAAGAFDSFSTYANPAGLPHSAGEKHLSLSWGILAAQPTFTPIRSVTTTNTYTSKDPIPRTGDIDLDYRSTLGQVFGLSYRFDGDRKLSLGLVAFLPLNHLAFVDSGELFAPEYFLYRARTQRPQLELGSGFSLGKGFSAGAGVHFGFGLTSQAIVLLEPGSSNPAPSTMRFLATIKPKASPFFGLLYAASGDPRTGWNTALVGRLPLASRQDMVVSAAANIVAPLDVKASATSALAYDPGSLEIGTSFPLSSAWRIFLQADYQLWSKFEAPAVVLADIPGEGMIVSPSRNPEFDYRDIVTAKMASETRIGKTLLRAGYTYRPGVIKDPPSEAGNYLDPSRHILQAGLGLEFPRLLHFETPWRLDLNLGYHHLVNQRVIKSPGNEIGDPIEPKVGAPGYEVGGRILAAGVSLSLEL